MLSLLIWEKPQSIGFKNACNGVTAFVSERFLFQRGFSKTCIEEFWRLGLMTNMFKAKEKYTELQKMKTCNFPAALLYSFALWVTVSFKSRIVKY